MKKSSPRFIGTMASVAALALLATGCATQGEERTSTATGTAPLAVSYANGIALLDGTSLETIKSFDTQEFTRLNSAGDGRSIMVTTTEGFQVLDTQTPQLRELTFGALGAGHVVRHGGKTVLFDDATGNSTIFNTKDLAGSGDKLPESQVIASEHAHHGVSVVLTDGTFLTTIADENSRSGIKALTKDGKEIARNESCPGVHGEGTAANEAVVFGCEDGALIYRNGVFTKLDTDEKFGRMGNAYTSETSSLVVGDYKDDPDAEGYLLGRLTLIDTEKPSYKVIDMPKGAQVTWRGVVRGENEHAYLLATDGAIHELDPQTGKFVNKFPVIAPWEGPSQWQHPHPGMTVNGNTAYVTDPATKQVHAVDLLTGKTSATATLTEQPNEIAVPLS